MESILKDMISQYQCQTQNDYQNAFKEVMQDIALLGLWRAKFFEHAAFYGGTALRILYGLNRFSEDLDFMLLKKTENFEFSAYQAALERELDAFGLSVEVREKKKTKESKIRSAFLKANTKELILKIGAPKSVSDAFQDGELIKIKLEIDTDPCAGFTVETHSLIVPVPFWVRTLSLSSLFAGKLHAVLCRNWGERVKGRDWFDMIWFIQRKVPVTLKFLEKKMRQTKHYSQSEALTQEQLQKYLHERIDDLDVKRAEEDICRFIHNRQMIEGWSQALFHSAVEKIIC